MPVTEGGTSAPEPEPDTALLPALPRTDSTDILWFSNARHVSHNSMVKGCTDIADCWLGKLVASGMAPQMTGCLPAAFAPCQPVDSPTCMVQQKVCEEVLPRVKCE